MTFSVEASSGTTLTYQWSFQGIPIVGATDKTHTVGNAQFNQVGAYRVAVINAGGTVNSSSAQLAIKNAPSLSGANNLAAINEDDLNNGGTLVSNLVAGQCTDLDPGALQGVAVTAVNNTAGTWQYSTNNGANWSSFGSPSPTSARLLACDTKTYVRFVPIPNFSGLVENGLTLRAWDRTTGIVGGTANTSTNGGISAFSASTATSTVTVNPINDAPVLAGANDLGNISEDDTNNVGTLVSDLTARHITDPDTNALDGIAVTSVQNANGAWQYSIDGGSSWNAFGTPTETSARLLPSDDTTYVRFVPNLNWTGATTNGLTFRAWDRTTGTAGETAIVRASGTMVDTFSTVAYNNNNGTYPWGSDWVDIDRDPTASSISITDFGTLRIRANNTTDWIYRQADLAGVTNAVVSFSYNSELNAGTGGRIDFQVSSNGGTNWVTLGTFSPSNNVGIGTFTADITAYATSNTRIRFSITGKSNPAKEINVDNLQIAYAANTVAGATAFSSATASSSITVTPINDPPVANSQTISTAEESPKPITLTGMDPENNPVIFAIVNGPTNGTLIGFNPTNGTVTYMPNTNFNGADSFTFSANDGLNNSAAATVAITVTPVNDRPVAYNQSVIAAESTPKTIALTGSDIDNNPLTFSILTGPANGLLSGFNPSNGTVVYTPNAHFHGTDAFNFQVNDGLSSSLLATVTIKVVPPPTLTGRSDGTNGFQLEFTGLPNATVSILASTNLIDWVTLFSTNSATGSGLFLDGEAARYSMRVYRCAQTP